MYFYHSGTPFLAFSRLEIAQIFTAVQYHTGEHSLSLVQPKKSIPREPERDQTLNTPCTTKLLTKSFFLLPRPISQQLPNQLLPIIAQNVQESQDHNIHRAPEELWLVWVSVSLDILPFYPVQHGATTVQRRPGAVQRRSKAVQLNAMTVQHECNAVQLRCNTSAT